jgi:hypothetical protein
MSQNLTHKSVTQRGHQVTRTERILGSRADKAAILPGSRLLRFFATLRGGRGRPALATPPPNLLAPRRHPDRAPPTATASKKPESKVWKRAGPPAERQRLQGHRQGTEDSTRRRGVVRSRPPATNRKVSVNAATRNSESQAGTARLLRAISVCAPRRVRSIGRHERNRRERHQEGTDWGR